MIGWTLGAIRICRDGQESSPSMELQFDTKGPTMTQTIFITGASSGIGKATASYFNDRGWNVVATMRDPAQGAALSDLLGVLVTRLDVTDGASIASAVDAALQRFGTIDVLMGFLITNADYLSPIQSTSDALEFRCHV